MVKMTMVQRFSKLALSLMLAIAVLMAPQLAAANVTKPKTPPPPPELVQPLSNYSGYTYLKSSATAVISNANASITVSSNTEAKAAVSEISVLIQLQEWSGSSWVNLIPTANAVKYNSLSASGTLTRYSKPGYYYRVKTIHTAKQGSTTEQVTEYSESFLAN